MDSTPRQSERACRVCAGPIGATQPWHHHTCTHCFREGRRNVATPAVRLRQMPGQTSIFDLLPAVEPEPEYSEYIAYEDERERRKRAA
jgi:hypothetical protein